MNGYELSRKWFDWSFENPEKISPNHSALYFFAIEHCNRLGWREKFGFPTEMAKDAIGIKSYTTYIRTLNDLVNWGFIIMIERSKNQYSSNIIALSNFDKALDKALDKAIVKHVVKQVESTCESICSIDKQLTINKEQSFNVEQKKLDQPKIDFDKLLKFINEATGRDFKIINKTVRSKYLARLKEGYTKEQIINAIVNACKDKNHIENGFKYLTPEFFSRADKIDMHGSEQTEKPVTFKKA